MAERRWRAAAAPAALSLVCAALALQVELGRADPARDVVARSTAITPRAQQLLDGLTVGDRVAGWSVISLDGPRERAIEIGLERDGVRFLVTVAPMGVRPQNPAVQTDRYAIYYGNAVPNDRPIPEGAVRAITAALSRRIARHEHDLDEP